MSLETASFSMDLLLRSAVVHRQRLPQYELGPHNKSTLSSSVSGNVKADVTNVGEGFDIFRNFEVFKNLKKSLKIWFFCTSSSSRVLSTVSSPRRGTYREQPGIPEYRSQPVPPERDTRFTRLVGVMVEGVCHPLRF